MSIFMHVPLSAVKVVHKQAVTNADAMRKAIENDGDSDNGIVSESDDEHVRGAPWVSVCGLV